MPNAQYHHLANEPLSVVLRSLERELGSAVIEVESPQGRGEVSIKNGRLLGAVFKDKNGSDALLAILALTAGRYQLHLITKRPSPASSAAGKTLYRASGQDEVEGTDAGPSLSELIESASVKNAQEPAVRVATRQMLTSNSSVPPAAEPASPKRQEPLVAHRVKTLSLEPRRSASAEPPKPVSVAPVQPVRAARPVVVSTRTIMDVSPPPHQRRAAESEAGSSEPDTLGSSERAAHSDPYSGGRTVRALGGEPPVPSILEAAPVASAPIETKAGFMATSIQGTAPRFDRSRPAELPGAQPSAWDDDPVPSQRFEKDTLERLGELNEAIQSSVRHEVPTRPQDTLSGSRAVGEAATRDGSAPSEPTDEPLPRVGRYEVLARLKRGGMGSVYLCRLTGSAGFRRLFAMKVLNAELQGQEALDSFFREAQLLSKLHHPNIVGIVDVGTSTQPYLVLDYVEGGSLAELCQASPQRDPKNVLSIILDALAGIDAAHRAVDDDGQPLGIVHCDLTPHNLLVGVDGACRVADFGIATQRNRTPEVMRGKPAYVAPERLLGQPGDVRSDLFSLGVVLYFALTGVEPFAAESAEVTLQNVLQKPIPSPSEVGLCPPPSLDWVCMKALARDPDERFQSAEDMMVHLRKVAAREELLTSQAQVADWVNDALRPNIENRRKAAQRVSDVASDPAARTNEAPFPPGVDAPFHRMQNQAFADRAPAPPPSYTTNEKTEYLPSLDREALERQAQAKLSGGLAALSRMPRERRMGLYAALGGIVFVLFLVLFLPALLGSIFAVEESPEHGADDPDAEQTSPAASEDGQAKDSEPDTGESDPAEPSEDPERRIQLPDISAEDGR